MGNIAFGLLSFLICMSLSARITKLERILKKSEHSADKGETLYNVLSKNIGEIGILTFRNGSAFISNKKIKCKILDVDEEWVYLEESKKKNQQLLHIDSIYSVQF